MGERPIKREPLELSLLYVDRGDILRKEHASAERAEKVGEIDVYVFVESGTDGRVIRKEVYDINGACKRTYFSDSETLEHGPESLRLMPLVGILRGRYVSIANKRRIS